MERYPDGLNGKIPNPQTNQGDRRPQTKVQGMYQRNITMEKTQDSKLKRASVDLRPKSKEFANETYLLILRNKLFPRVSICPSSQRKGPSLRSPR